MAYFAKLNNNNIVQEIISVNDKILLDNEGNEIEKKGIDFLNSLYKKEYKWKKTSFNTIKGVHYTGITPSENQSKSFRKNFAKPGYVYDEERDAFIPPKPFNSWILNENTCGWEAPIQKPISDDNFIYVWNEDILNWKKITE